MPTAATCGTVVVTGIAGRIGGGIGTKLREEGYRIVGVDRVPEPGDIVSSGACDAYVQCDLVQACDAGAAASALTRAMMGASAVVHCAAWPGPSATPPPAVVAAGSAVATPKIGLEPTPPPALLRDNVASTSAVCDAAVKAGVRRVVFSSSAFAMGYSHAASGEQAFAPQYLPIDEAHPPLPHESYGLSKAVGEEVLETAARTARSTSFVSLRFSNVIKREAWGTLPWSPPTDFEPLTLLMWAYAHEDDVVTAHVAAVTAPAAAAVGTHEAYMIAAPDTRFAEPTLPLMRAALGMDVPPLRGPMDGNASPLSSRKAVERLGFSPRSWQHQPWQQPRQQLAGARGSAAAIRAREDPQLRHYPLEGFRLDCGARLPAGATLAYKLHGPRIGKSAGLILHPTSFDAVHTELEYQIGETRALDTSRFTVLVVNQFGNGVSYSPSLFGEAARAAPPPTFTVADNVRAQKLLIDAIGVSLKEAPLELVYGYSMGALQAYEWAASYPDAVKRIAVVCGAARCSEINAVFLRSLELALQADAAWDAKAGHFKRTPTRGLAAFGAIYAGWGVGAEYYEARRYKGAGFATADEFVERSYLPAFAHCDADDLLSQIRTWRAADIARDDDDGAAFARIRAKVLLMPSDTDRYFTLGASRAEAKALGDRAALAPIRSAAGHRAGDPHRPELADEREYIRSRLHKFLGP